MQHSVYGLRALRIFFEMSCARKVRQNIWGVTMAANSLQNICENGYRDGSGANVYLARKSLGKWLCWIVQWKLYTPDYITWGFQRVLKNNHLHKMRFHDLRHSTASILYGKGWSLKDIQEWLEHADMETTGDIYTHISQIRRHSMAKNIQNIFSLWLLKSL